MQVALADDGQTEHLDLEGLIACPVCDALHNLHPVPVGEIARCHRCHSTLMAPRASAMTQIVMLAASALILMVAAVFFPFLDLSAAGFSQESSVIDAITAFSDGLLFPLSFAVAALIVVLPAIRLAAILYVLGPMMIGERPARHAIPAFRLAEALKPWSMAEIFVVGVAVALVKIGGMAQVHVGPAFWAFVALVVITALKDTFMCRLTVWKTLEERSQS
mgnify:CR=1